MDLDGVLKNEPLSKYTTVGIGGPAQYLYISRSSDDLSRAVIYARSNNIPFNIIGRGSNLLVCDEGIKGLTVVNVEGKYEISSDTNDVINIVCDSGLSLQKLSLELFDKNIIGLENFSGIPCSIGGAIYNNIHGKNVMFCNHVKWIEYLDENNKVCRVMKDECNFGYDKSIFQTNGGIILRVCLSLKIGDGTKAKEVWDNIRKEKLEVQPQRSLGCVFKNLSADVVLQNKFPTPSTGWYIQSMLKMTGHRVGDAKISSKHHNFIENVGNATFNDYIQVVKNIQNKSEKEFGITLEPEFQILEN